MRVMQVLRCGGYVTGSRGFASSIPSITRSRRVYSGGRGSVFILGYTIAGVVCHVYRYR